MPQKGKTFSKYCQNFKICEFSKRKLVTISEAFAFIPHLVSESDFDKKKYCENFQNIWYKNKMELEKATINDLEKITERLSGQARQ